MASHVRRTKGESAEDKEISQQIIWFKTIKMEVVFAIRLRHATNFFIGNTVHAGPN